MDEVRGGEGNGAPQAGIIVWLCHVHIHELCCQRGRLGNACCIGEGTHVSLNCVSSGSAPCRELCPPGSEPG
jgi:hypothetical protein